MDDPVSISFTDATDFDVPSGPEDFGADDFAAPFSPEDFGTGTGGQFELGNPESFELPSFEAPNFEPSATLPGGGGVPDDNLATMVSTADASTSPTLFDGSGGIGNGANVPQIIADADDLIVAPTLRGGNGEQLSPTSSQDGVIRTFANPDRTIVEFDREHAQVGFHRQLESNVLGDDWVVRTSDEEADALFDSSSGVLFGADFYNNKTPTGLAGGTIGFANQVLPESSYHDGVFFNPDVRFPGRDLGDYEGSPGVVIRDGELEVVEDVGSQFSHDQYGGVLINSGEVDTLIPGMDPYDLPDHQADQLNGSNVLIQVTDDGSNGSSGVEKKIILIQTPSDSLAAGETIEEAEAVDLVRQTYGLPDNAQLDASAYDPGSSNGVLVAPEGGSLTPADAPASQNPAPGMTDNINNPSFFTVMPRSE